MKMNINATFEALDNHYQSEGNSLNVDHLIDALTLWLCNTEPLIMAAQNGTRKATAIAWETLFSLTSDHLKGAFAPHTYAPSSYHLKRYFERYGLDYKSVLAPLVEYIEAERKECAA